jgi:hypothetical protein
METAENILNLLEDSIESKFKTDDHITIQYKNGIQVTIDFDEQWCRIYRFWVLQKGLDLGLYWNDPKRCSEIIMSEINKFSLVSI